MQEKQKFQFSARYFFLLWPFLERERRVVWIFVLRWGWDDCAPHWTCKSATGCGCHRCQHVMSSCSCAFVNILLFFAGLPCGGTYQRGFYSHSDIEFVIAPFFNLSWLNNSNAQIFIKCHCFSLLSCIEGHTCWVNVSSLLEVRVQNRVQYTKASLQTMWYGTKAAKTSIWLMWRMALCLTMSDVICYILRGSAFLLHAYVNKSWNCHSCDVTFYRDINLTYAWHISLAIAHSVVDST